MFFRHFQHNYRCCCRDVNRGVVVSVCGMSAKLTLELSLRLAIGLIAVVALGAGAAGVARIHGDNGDAMQFPLVLDEVPQLGKAPSANPSSLTLAKPCSHATLNPLEILNGDSATSAFAEHYESFTDFVVLVSPVSRLLVSDPLESPTCVLPGATLEITRHLLAERSACVVILAANLLNAIACNRFPVAGTDDLGDSHVNADEFLDFNRRILREIDGAVQIELTTPVDKIALAFEAGQPATLILAKHNRNDLTTGQGEQADFINALESHQPIVINNRAGGLKCWAMILVSGKALARLSNRPDAHLCRQSELLANREVARVVQRCGAVLLNAKASLGCKVGGLIEGPHRFKELRGLFWRWEQLDLQREFHTNILGSILS